jgi:hypothetical protein
MPYRLFYKEHEIEAIMEDELAKSGYPGRGQVDVDGFVENHLGIVPDFVPLPEGVQGATDFSRDGSVRMRISALLSERAMDESAAERLLRTTLAHEAAHVLLHRILFLQQSEAMFRSESSRLELCRDIQFTSRGYSGEWWEWQANRGMAALVLPKSAVVTAVRRLRASAASQDQQEVELARMFNVSRQAATYRMQQLGMNAPPGQVAWGL